MTENTEAKEPLRVVTRVSGESPGVVRMQDLAKGDLFTLDDHGKKVFRACGEPYQQAVGPGAQPGVASPDGPNVWAIAAEQA